MKKNKNSSHFDDGVHLNDPEILSKQFPNCIYFFKYLYFRKHKMLDFYNLRAIILKMTGN